MSCMSPEPNPASPSIGCYPTISPHSAPNVPRKCQPSTSPEASSLLSVDRGLIKQKMPPPTLRSTHGSCLVCQSYSGAPQSFLHDQLDQEKAGFMAPTPVKVSGSPCAAYALVDANDLARAPPASLCVVLLLGYRPDKEAGGGPQGWGKLERAEVQHTYLETTGFRHGEEKKQSFSVFGGRAARSNFDTEVVSPPVPRIHSLLYTGGDPSWPAPRRGILWHLREARERRERSQPATLAFSSMGDSVNTHVSRKSLRGCSRHVDFSGVVRKDFPPLALPRPVVWGDSWQETRDRAG